MPTDYELLAERARAALIVAAQRRTTLTYGELAAAIDLDLPPNHHMRRILDRVSARCIDAGEHSLAALAVRADTGLPGSGWKEGAVPFHVEQRRLYDDWSGVKR